MSTSLKTLSYFKYFFDYMKDGDYPLLEKAFIIAGITYIIVPFDLVPDVILPIGFIDDSIVLTSLVVFSARALKGYYGKTVKVRMEQLEAKRQAEQPIEQRDIEEDW